VRRHRGLAEALRSFPLKEALDLEAVGRYARTIGPPVWHNVEGMTARASIENLLLTGIESLPTNCATPAGCMAMLSTVGEEWPTTIADVVRKVRQKGLDRLRLRLEAAVAEGALPASTDIDGLSRFYLSVFQRMAIQP
jgi:hypothetical protein